jgi:hypothetical protein
VVLGADGISDFDGLLLMAMAQRLLSSDALAPNVGVATKTSASGSSLVGQGSCPDARLAKVQNSAAENSAQGLT